MKRIENFNQLCEKLLKFKCIEGTKIEIVKMKKYKYIAISVAWLKTEDFSEEIHIFDFPKHKSVSIEFLDKFRVAKNYMQAYKAITSLFSKWEKLK